MVILVQEMLALLIQILQERRFCGLSTAESLRREIIFKLATGDFTHSQLVKSLPRELSKSDELQEGKYSLRSSCWKELDLYHPRWHSRELQSAEERFSRYCGVSAVTTQLPRWRMIYPPLKGLSRIGTCKATFQIICSTLYYALQSGTSVKSRAQDGVLISALHLLSLSLDICTQQRGSNIQACCVEDSIPILELAGLEIIGLNQGTGKESLLSLLVSLMRTREGDGLHQFPEAGSCNISSWIGNLLKKFSEIDSVCMNLLQSLAPEVVGHSGFDKAISGSASDDTRKAKARERQAAILAKMKAEQSKFLSTLSSSMDDDDLRSETETSDSVVEQDSEIAIREVCSFCHDPDSKDPVSFLIFLQKSKLLSFVNRGPPSLDQCPQSEKKIPMDEAPDLQRINVSSDSLRMIPHVLQLSDDATSESATDSVLEALTARLLGNGQKEKRSSDGRGKDESNLESLETAMYQTVRKKTENMINQSLTHVNHRQPDSESSSVRSSVGGLSTLHRFQDIRSKQTSRYLDVSADGFHPADCDGVYLSSCGHAVHQSCLERYLNSLKERSDRRNVFEGAHIVDLVQSAANVIEDGDSLKAVSLQGDEPRRKDLQSVSNKLWNFYFSKRQEKPPGSAAGSWKNINLLWSRASDPVLAHDPFSSLMWALFCLPSPFITCEESLLSIVHIFYSVSVIQTVITYCAGRLCYTSELDFKENLLSDISIALRESGGWEYFRLLKTAPGKFHEEVHMFDVPSDSNSDYMDFMYSPQSELNHSRVKGPLCITPVVTFQLMKLPNLYQDLLQRYIKSLAGTARKLSKNLHYVFSVEDCVLLYGDLVAEKVVETHAVTCGAGTGVYLLIRRTTILLQRFARQSPWPSPYLDTFGEEDIDMLRGKPLYLNEERYAALTYMVGSHGLDVQLESSQLNHNRSLLNLKKKIFVLLLSFFSGIVLCVSNQQSVWFEELVY
ncbi:hypothetical protein Bca52824_055904 [Brassica carinata]|uniref:E3 ubiquitin-protein ligase n=1 Tax=Brassica carinata TaxID=52824 RepID=A0A8X7UN78_BRACI|nr:hypothetical protein Bca52824_055904 [Brassica carinata]